MESIILLSINWDYPNLEKFIIFSLLLV